MDHKGSLNIVGEYDNKGQVNLEGKPEDLRKFAAVLREIDAEQICQLYVPDKPSEWVGYLTTLRLAISDMRRLEIKRRGTELNIIGDKISFNNIAFHAAGLADDTERVAVYGHNHIDYPAWEEITEDSDALIICCDAREYLMEIKQIEIISADGSRLLGELSIWHQAPNNVENVQLSLRFNGEEITQKSDNYFSAFCDIRWEMEKENIYLNCYGASKNVYPSPMSIDMGGGMLAYKLTLGQHARTSDLVSIFDTGDDIILSTVEEQEAFYHLWLDTPRIS